MATMSPKQQGSLSSSAMPSKSNGLSAHINNNNAMASNNNNNSSIKDSNHSRHNRSIAVDDDDPHRSVLVEGKLLSGEALLEYATCKGLCTKCVHHVTHRKARKRINMVRYVWEWIPLTVKDELEGNYTVYKGYCLQPTCWTLAEAQTMLGEHSAAAMTRSKSRGKMTFHSTPTRQRLPAEDGGGMEQRASSRGRDQPYGSSSSRGTPHRRRASTTTSSGADHYHAEDRDSSRRRGSVSTVRSRATTPHRGERSNEPSSRHEYRNATKSRSYHHLTRHTNEEASARDTTFSTTNSSSNSSSQSKNQTPSRQRARRQSVAPSSVGPRAHSTRNLMAEAQRPGLGRSSSSRFSSTGSSNCTQPQLSRNSSGGRRPLYQANSHSSSSTRSLTTTSGHSTQSSSFLPNAVKRQGSVSSSSSSSDTMRTSVHRRDRHETDDTQQRRRNHSATPTERQRSEKSPARPRSVQTRSKSVGNSREASSEANTNGSSISYYTSSNDDNNNHDNHNHTSSSSENAHNYNSNGASSTATPSSSSRSGTRSVVRKAVPDSAILRQLCRQHRRNSNAATTTGGSSSSGGGNAKGLSAASDADLWKNLHKRYGSHTTSTNNVLLSSVDTSENKILLLLRVMQVLVDDLACMESSWALLCGLLRQTDSTNDAIVREALTAVVSQLDRVNYDDTHGQCQKYAARTLFHMLKAEEHSFDSQVLDLLQSLGMIRRQHWIAVLLDTLMFQDSGKQEDKSGTTETLFVVWNLLLSQPLTEETEDISAKNEEMFMLKTVVGIAVSLLSTECSLYSSGDSHKINRDLDSWADDGLNTGLLLSETALGVLATVASRGGGMALAGRQNECIKIAYDTMRACPVSDVLLQGVHAICHIVGTYNWSEQESPDQQAHQEFDRNSPPSYDQSFRTAEVISGAVTTVLSYLNDNTAAEVVEEEEGLSSAGCRLLTALFESNEEIRRFVVELLCSTPTVVQGLAGILEATSHVGLAENASELLVFLLNMDFTARNNLRLTDDIADKLVGAMERHQASPFVVESLCLIVAELTALEDHSFGQEIGAVGGLTVLTNLLCVPEQHTAVTVASSRCLVGILSSIEHEALDTHQKVLSDACFSLMKQNAEIVEVQLAGLDVLHCLCIRSDGFIQDIAAFLTLLAQSMENHLVCEPLLVRCCSIVRMLGKTTGDYKAFADSGIVKMVVNAMLIHADAIDLVMEGMATLKDLAAEASFRQHFDRADAEDAVVSILEANSYSSEVLALGFATLNNVVVDSRDNTVAPMSEAVLDRIVAALKEFAADEDVFSNTCLLLKSFTYQDQTLQLLRDNSNLLIPLLMECKLSAETNERAQSIMGKLYDPSSGFQAS